MLLLNTYNTLELSGLFVCLGGLTPFFSAWETEQIAGLWFARAGGWISTQVDTMINCENMHMSARILSNQIKITYHREISRIRIS